MLLCDILATRRLISPPSASLKSLKVISTALCIYNVIIINTSTPVIRTGVYMYPHMPITVTSQFVTRGSRLPGQFVTHGSTAVQCIINLSLFGLGRLTPWPKFTKLGEGLQQAPLCHPQTVYEMCVTEIFTFWPRGLTPRPKFTKIGDDLLPTQVYHPAKFYCPASTHAGDIRDKKICG